MQIEVCASSLTSVFHAAQAGADRVELCTELSLGGLTPSYGFVKQALLLKLPLHVLIRPRSGHFTYSENEINVMYEDILQFKTMGCAGVVVGLLNEKYELANKALEKMKRLAGSMQITFHRAIDLVRNPEESLEALVDMGFTRVLSSGQQINALKGIELLSNMQEWSRGRIAIMPGGGINLENCLYFKQAGFQHLHFSGFKEIKQEKYPTHLKENFSFLEQPFGHSDKTMLKKIIDKIKEDTT